jgi:fumarate reductase subunit D
MLFGIGGFLVAFLFPVQILLYGIAMPLGLLPWPSYRSTLTLVQCPLTRIYLGVLLIFAFWHAGYRIRDTVCDAFAMRHVDVFVAALCFAFATVGTVLTIALLCYIP